LVCGFDQFCPSAAKLTFELLGRHGCGRDSNPGPQGYEPDDRSENSIIVDGRIQPTEGDAPVMNFRSAARSADPNLLKVGPGGPAGNHFKLSEVCRRNGGAFRRLRGEIHMGWWDDKLQDAIAAVTRGGSVAKLGPGVLGSGPSANACNPKIVQFDAIQ